MEYCFRSRGINTGALITEQTMLAPCQALGCIKLLRRKHTYPAAHSTSMM